MSKPRPNLVDSGHAEIGTALATYLPSDAAIVLLLAAVLYIGTRVGRFLQRRSRISFPSNDQPP